MFLCVSDASSGHSGGGEDDEGNDGGPTPPPAEAGVSIFFEKTLASRSPTAARTSLCLNRRSAFLSRDAMEHSTDSWRA